MNIEHLLFQDLEAAIDILKLLEKEKIDRHVLKVCA
jgi:hypothetical protein